MKEKLVVGFFAIIFMASIAVGVMYTLKTPEQKIPKPAFLAGKEGYGVVHLYGHITGSDEMGMAGKQRGVDSVVSRLQTLGENPRVKAIVLRVNSPGGSVAASQELYREIQRLKTKGVPVVVSVSDMGASGGYYAACGANKILANPGSMVGSIGVIALFPNIQVLLEQKLGVRTTVMKTGKWKDAGSPLRDLTPEEQERFKKQLEQTYGQFFGAVKDARLNAVKTRMHERLKVTTPDAPVPDDKAAIEYLQTLAQGQVFLGEEALTQGLVDGLGDFTDAVAEAKTLAGLPEDAREIVPPLQLEDILESLGRGMVAKSSDADPVGAAAVTTLNNITSVRMEYLYLPGGLLK